MLAGTEVIILIVIFTFEFKEDSHKSKPIFIMDTTYYGCLVILNILPLCKYEYFKDDEIMKELLEEMITLMIYLMIIMLVLKIVWEYFPWSWLRKTLC